MKNNLIVGLCILLGLAIYISVLVMRADKVEIVVWEEPSNVACHWMPSFNNKAICQKYEENGKYVTWGDIYEIKVSPSDMQKLLDEQKSGNFPIPEVMNKPTKKNSYITFIAIIMLVACGIFVYKKTRYKTS